MSNKIGQVVVVDLVGKGMFRGDEHIGKEARLGWGDVGKPAAALSQS